MDGFWTRIGKKELKTLPFKNFALAEETKSGKIPRGRQRKGFIIGFVVKSFVTKRLSFVAKYHCILRWRDTF